MNILMPSDVIGTALFRGRSAASNSLVAVFILAFNARSLALEVLRASCLALQRASSSSAPAIRRAHCRLTG
jgi:hypothetical protein